MPNFTNIFCIVNTSLLILITACATPIAGDLEIVSRKEWGARPAAVQPDKPVKPVPYVVIHHTFEPRACNTSSECEQAMRWMQDFHQFNRSWWDIGYNFAVGGDGKAYEGRGWDVVGAHALKYNKVSVGIALIGDWGDSPPPEHQLEKARQLIESGVAKGYIATDYRLVGHRQVRAGTTCPGNGLYDKIKAWPHFDAAPHHLATDGKGAVPEVATVPVQEGNKLRKRMTPPI